MKFGFTLVLPVIFSFPLFSSPALADYDNCAYLEGASKCTCYREKSNHYHDVMRDGYTNDEYKDLEKSRRYYASKARFCRVK